jgi:hypothetical protein
VQVNRSSILSEVYPGPTGKTWMQEDCNQWVRRVVTSSGGDWSPVEAMLETASHQIKSHDRGLGFPFWMPEMGMP